MSAIRYCTTPAGHIAYSTAGAGPALLCDSGWVTAEAVMEFHYPFSALTASLEDRTNDVQTFCLRH
jgi:hypothetical protein